MKQKTGFTMVELLVLFGVLGIVFLIAFINLRPLSSPLQNNIAQTTGFFRLVRNKAMASTSAYRIVRFDAHTLKTEYANNCAALTWTADPQLQMTFGEGVELVNNAPVLICYNSRGQASSSLTLNLKTADGKQTCREFLIAGGQRKPEGCNP